MSSSYIDFQALTDLQITQLEGLVEDGRRILAFPEDGLPVYITPDGTIQFLTDEGITPYSLGLLGGVDQSAWQTALGIAGLAGITVDADTTLSANSDFRVPSQKAVKTYVDGKVVGLLELQGGTDCSANPNYPAALKGDAWYVTVAGRIGGASGKVVEIGDVYLATADNAGGDEAAVGASWIVLQKNLDGVVMGPALAVDNTLPRFDGTTGKLLQGSGIVVSDNNEISGHKALVNLTTANTYTAVAADSGTIRELSDGTGVAVTLDPALPKGWNCTYVQAGAGFLTFVSSGSGSVVNRQSHTKSAGQNAFVTVYVRSNSGSDAVFVMGGDTAP